MPSPRGMQSFMAMRRAPGAERFSPAAHNRRASAIRKAAKDDADRWIAEVRARKAARS